MCPEPGAKPSPEFVYAEKGWNNPYVFTFHASVFHSGKIESIVAVSKKDDLAVTIEGDGKRADVSRSSCTVCEISNRHQLVAR